MAAIVLRVFLYLQVIFCVRLATSKPSRMTSRGSPIGYLVQLAPLPLL